MLPVKKPQKISVRLAVHTPEVERNLERITSSLDGFYLQRDKNASEVDVLIFEIGVDPAAEFDTIKELLHDGVVGTVFLTSKRATSDVLVPALRTGAKEFFEQPIVAENVKKAFQQVLEQHSSKVKEPAEYREPGKVISVFGAKGGVGTTTFAVNIANCIQLRNAGKTVALVDMNKLLGEIPILLDLETDFNWDELATNIARLDTEFLTQALVQHNSGMYVMPAPNRADTNPQVMLQVLEKTRNAFDFVIIDIGMQVDDLMYSILGMSDLIYLIAILSLPCMVNVKRRQESLLLRSHIPTDNVRVVLNRFEKKSAISVEEAEKVIDNIVFAKIPNDYKATMEAINIGKPLAEVAAGSKVEKSYRELAETLVNESAGKKKRKAWLW